MSHDIWNTWMVQCTMTKENDNEDAEVVERVRSWIYYIEMKK